MSRVHVIGMGNVGRRLAGALEASGWTVHRVTRRAGWDRACDADDDAPRIVAVREEHVGAALQRLGERLRPRIILVQNGFLEAVLGDLGPVGRGLIWFTSKGEFFRALRPSPFHAVAARSLVPALTEGGVPSEILGDRESLTRAMIVKGVWNAVVGLPLAVHDVTLGDYLDRHRDELEALVRESALAASAAYDVGVSGDEALRAIEETTGPIRHVRGGAKALPFRNGAIAALGRRHGVPTPVTDRLLIGVGYDPDAPPAT